MRRLLITASAATLIALAPIMARPAAAAPEPKYTICHRTDAVGNPYVKITVRQRSVDGVAGNQPRADHFNEHTGPIFDPTTMVQGDSWGDIIPPVPGFHDGLNWTDEGQTILENGCNVATPTTTPPPTSTTPPPSSTTPPPTSGTTTPPPSTHTSKPPPPPNSPPTPPHVTASTGINALPLFVLAGVLAIAGTFMLRIGSRRS
jgi:hypothetical protein